MRSGNWVIVLGALVSACTAAAPPTDGISGKGDDPIPGPEQPSSPADATLDGRVIHFATAAEAASLLTQPDAYLAALSPFDRSLATMTEGEVTTDDYLAFLEASARDWTDGERNRLTEVFAAIEPKLSGYELPLPAAMELVKVEDTVGKPYTRSHFIVIPTSTLERSDDDLQQILIHELFHVLSRANPELRDELYAIIGFSPCPALVFPEALADAKMTNPDTPVLAHCITIQSQWGPYPMIPITYAKKPFSNAVGTDIFQYLDFELLGVEKRPDGSVPLNLGDQPWMTNPFQSQSYLSQIGMNTMYIVHPDEILADNFTFLVLGSQVQTPRIPDAMGAILAP